jgi:hypothetical protein
MASLILQQQRALLQALVPGQNNNKKDVVADKDLTTNTKPVGKGSYPLKRI